MALGALIGAETFTGTTTAATGQGSSSLGGGPNWYTTVAAKWSQDGTNLSYSGTFDQFANLEYRPGGTAVTRANVDQWVLVSGDYHKTR